LGNIFQHTRQFFSTLNLIPYSNSFHWDWVLGQRHFSPKFPKGGKQFKGIPFENQKTGIGGFPFNLIGVWGVFRNPEKVSFRRTKFGGLISFLGWVTLF